MEGDIQQEFRLFETKDILEQDQVTRTAYRQEFGQPLNNAQKDTRETVRALKPLVTRTC